MTAINYQDGLILNQKTTVEELDYDPSEHLDWNWEDYEQGCLQGKQAVQSDTPPQYVIEYSLALVFDRLVRQNNR